MFAVAHLRLSIRRPAATPAGCTASPAVAQASRASSLASPSVEVRRIRIFPAASSFPAAAGFPFIGGDWRNRSIPAFEAPARCGHRRSRQLARPLRTLPRVPLLITYRRRPHVIRIGPQRLVAGSRRIRIAVARQRHAAAHRSPVASPSGIQQVHQVCRLLRPRLLHQIRTDPACGPESSSVTPPASRSAKLSSSPPPWPGLRAPVSNCAADASTFGSLGNFRQRIAQPRLGLLHVLHRDRRAHHALIIRGARRSSYPAPDRSPSRLSAGPACTKPTASALLTAGFPGNACAAAINISTPRRGFPAAVACAARRCAHDAQIVCTCRRSSSVMSCRSPSAISCR